MCSFFSFSKIHFLILDQKNVQSFRFSVFIPLFSICFQLDYFQHFSICFQLLFRFLAYVFSIQPFRYSVIQYVFSRSIQLFRYNQHNQLFDIYVRHIVVHAWKESSKSSTQFMRHWNQWVLHLQRYMVFELNIPDLMG